MLLEFHYSLKVHPFTSTILSLNLCCRAHQAVIFKDQNKYCRLEGQAASAVITCLCWCTAKTASEKTSMNGLGYAPIKLYSRDHYMEVSTVVHACGTNTQEGEAGRLPQCWCQVELHGEFNASLGYKLRTVTNSINQSINE